MRVPPLETERLIIRPFTLNDLDDIHQILDVDLLAAEFGTEGANTRDERKSWLQWTILSYEELAKLNQPPYGDRAVVLKQTQQVIGACGFVPCFRAFEQLPSLRSGSQDADVYFKSPEFGLFYALSPTYQRQGYTTEAIQALINYAFTQLHLKRIVATTTYENVASIGVMRNVGMRIEKNPFPDPPWFQVVGILENRPANLRQTRS
ncbi:alanine acetyltransferase [Tengunoibacter tsumagoiensis]|uniref:Alanine acetyltransferase n=2 Tax=Tengunoibacter tsumagoiensis TaxID=2014871 RepID=A0A402A835_9CHLR|nr:alanine acetyltransferase [Tengunoibacter tsumagoiensis]